MRIRWIERLRQLWARRSQPARTRPCGLCGEPVKVGALACRACGSDAQTGWSADAGMDSVDFGKALDDFDYEAYLDKEFSNSRGNPLRNPVWRKRMWMMGLVLLIGLLLIFGMR